MVVVEWIEGARCTVELYDDFVGEISIFWRLCCAGCVGMQLSRELDMYAAFVDAAEIQNLATCYNVNVLTESEQRVWVSKKILKLMPIHHN